MSLGARRLGVETLVPLDPSSLSARYYQPDELHLKFGRGYAVHVRTGTCSSQDHSSGVHAIALTRPSPVGLVKAIETSCSTCAFTPPGCPAHRGHEMPVRPRRGQP